MRSLFHLILMLAFGYNAQAQTNTYKVHYVESSNAVSSVEGYNLSSALTGDTVSIQSRLGKLEAIIYDYDYFPESVIRCIEMAMNTWEENLVIDHGPLCIEVGLDDNLDDGNEIVTTVLYSKVNPTTSAPSSLIYSQNTLGGSSKQFIGSIVINANKDWDPTWIGSSPYGNEKLTTALLRHFAHLFGFGTSVVKRDSGYGFSVGISPSVFDQLMCNASGVHLQRNTNLNTFLCGNIYVDVDNVKYKLYSESSAIVPHRTGCYFSLNGENIMNYPYTDRSKLLAIDGITLKVMKAIGWTVRETDYHITGSNLDVLGYGSAYTPHEFSLVDDAGNQVSNASWKFQYYNPLNKDYTQKKNFSGKVFKPTFSDIIPDSVDQHKCYPGRVVCTVGTKEYHLPVTLDMLPYMQSYQIKNIKKGSNNKASIDFVLNQYGSNSIKVSVTDDFSSAFNVYMPTTNPSSVHINNVPTTDKPRLMLFLTNGYGTTFKTIYLNFQTPTGLSVSDNWKPFVVENLTDRLVPIPGFNKLYKSVKP